MLSVRNYAALAVLAFSLCFSFQAAHARDIEEIKASGVLRHLGVPYANFVTGQGDGLDVELVRLFAKHLGVRYEYVQCDWDSVIPDLIGRELRARGDAVELLEESPIRGDVIANGLTVLPWRRKIMDFSTPTFPTQVWLVAASDSPITPIVPTGDMDKDIELTRAKLRGVNLLTKRGGCLDPSLFPLEAAGARPVIFKGGLNDMAAAVFFHEGDASLLDVPDAMVALEKYPGKLKVIGPMTAAQDMALGFNRKSPGLRAEFDRFFASLVKDGAYDALVRKYYPLVHDYFPGFFQR